MRSSGENGAARDRLRQFCLSPRQTSRAAATTAGSADTIPFPHVGRRRRRPSHHRLPSHLHALRTTPSSPIFHEWVIYWFRKGRLITRVARHRSRAWRRRENPAREKSGRPSSRWMLSKNHDTSRSVISPARTSSLFLRAACCPLSSSSSSDSRVSARNSRRRVPSEAKLLEKRRRRTKVYKANVKWQVKRDTCTHLHVLRALRFETRWKRDRGNWIKLFPRWFMNGCNARSYIYIHICTCLSLSLLHLMCSSIMKLLDTGITFAMCAPCVIYCIYKHGSSSLGDVAVSVIMQ